MELVRTPIDPAVATRLVQDATLGGVVVFLGDVRGVTGSRHTDRLEYEAHEVMALAQMRTLAEEAAERFAANVAIVHRLGEVGPGETTVVCAAACAHRAEAFECCHHLIDTLKSDVPIWKKEFGPDGEEWVHPLAEGEDSRL